MIVQWTLEAIRDRKQIYDFIESDNPLAALQLDSLVSSSVANLSEYPEIGREGRVLGKGFGTLRRWCVRVDSNYRPLPCQGSLG